MQTRINIILLVARYVMYVCICRGITESHIQAAVRDGARSMKDLRQQLGIGEECGSCGSSAKQCLREASSNQTSTSSLSYAAA